MQLPDRSGIACDLCGTSHQKDFTYYSTDIHMSFVYNNRRPQIQELLTSKVVGSLDVCPKCFEDDWRLKIVDAYKICSPTNMVCELTGKVLTNINKFFYCVMTEVVVKASTQYVCSKCRKPVEGQKQCICGSTAIVKPSNVTADERFCEFGISEAEFDRLMKGAEAIKTRIGTWGSSS